jgi:hypothetical protein
MGWLCFVLLIFWAIWVFVTNIGKIVTFVALAVCGIVAACFGLLALEYIIIGLARAATFIEDHGGTILMSVGGIGGVLVAWCVRDSYKTKEQQKENLNAMFARKDELIAGNPHFIEFFKGYDDEYREWRSKRSPD